MGTQRFATGVRFVWERTTYCVVRLLPDQKVNIEDILTGGVQILPLKQLIQAVFEGNIELLPSEGQVAPSTTSIDNLDLTDYPPEWVATARFRFKAIEPLLSETNLSRADVLARVELLRSENPSTVLSNSRVSTASVYRWLNLYKRSGFDLRSLIPNFQRRGNPMASRLADAETIIDQVIADLYGVREQVTISVLFHEVTARINEHNALLPIQQHLRKPSRSTIARRVKSLEPERFRAAKIGSKAAAETTKQYGKTSYPSKPLERVEIDHTILDIIVVDDDNPLLLYGRPTITWALCMGTRYPFGRYVGFEPPSYLTVMECLYHAFRPKDNVKEQYGTQHEWLSYGIPTELIVDRGREFYGDDLRDACDTLGIKLTYAPPRMPQFKAGIERAFRSLNTGLIHTLPGTTFSNIQQRGDYKSEKKAHICMSDFMRILMIYMVDIYAQSYHRGLGGIPAKRWQDAIDSGFQPLLPVNARDLGIILGRVDERVIHHYGIEFESIRYNSPALGPLRDRIKNHRVKIKYHPQDLSAIYIRDESQRAYLTIPAIDQTYTSHLSLWKHRVIRRHALQEMGEVSPEALAQARRKIRSIISTSKHQASLRGRKRITRWERGGHALGEQSTHDQPQPTHPTSGEQFLSSTDSIDSLPRSQPSHQTTYADVPPLDSTREEMSSLVEDTRNDSMDGWGITYRLGDSSQ